MNKNRTSTYIEELAERVLLSYKTEPVDLLGIGDEDGEYRYLTNLMSGYLETVKDIVHHFENVDYSSIKILEIGSFLGFVSILLSELGFVVTASDIEEFISCDSLRRKLTAHGVDYASCNLREYELPFPDESYDVVIMCEVLEHLNFNPLPAIKDINRVIRWDFLFEASKYRETK